MLEKRAAKLKIEAGGGLVEMKEWKGEPEGSFVQRSTIIIVTFDQR